MHHLRCLVLTIFVTMPFYVTHAQAQSGDSWKWHSMTAQELTDAQTLAAKRQPPGSFMVSAPIMLPVSHPLSVRLQYWLDLLRGRLIQKNPSYEKIPAPKIRILETEELNAYVNGATACAAQPLSFENGGDKFSDVDVWFTKSDLATEKVLFGGFTTDRLSVCDTFPKDASPFLVEVLNPDCRLVNQNGMLVGNKECLATVGGGDYRPTSLRSKYIGYQTTASVISISTSLLNMAENEAQLIGALYHEAGHYYEAHLTTGTDFRYTYFYNDHEFNGIGLPTREPKLKSAGLSALSLGQTNSFHDIPNSQFHPLLAEFIDNTNAALLQPNKPGSEWGLQGMCAKDQKCMDKCKAFSSTMENLNLKSIAYLTTQNESPSPKSVAAYLRAENAFINCAKAMKLRTGDPTSLEDYYRLQSKLAYFFLLDLRTYPPKDEEKKWPTLYEVARGAEQFLVNREKALENALKLHLGYYTLEQEADRFALEQMVEMGIDPGNFADLTMQFFKEVERRSKNSYITAGVIRYKDCVRYRESGWQQNGEPISIPVAEYSDPHHSSCYRTATVDKLIRGNRWNQFRATTKTLDNNEWRHFLQKNLPRG